MATNNLHRTAGAAEIRLPIAGACKVLTGMALAGASVFGVTAAAGAAEAPGAGEVDPEQVNRTPAAAAPSQEKKTETAPAADEAADITLDGTAILTWGSAGNNVSTLQTALNAQGADIKVDGVFGPATDQAVRDFQAENDLNRVDGRVGPETRDALNGTEDASGAEGASAPARHRRTGRQQAVRCRGLHLLRFRRRPGRPRGRPLPDRRHLRVGRQQPGLQL